MRLWSLHPSLLDRAALVAGWREALLAQAVLAGRTRGYTNHPQLSRFRKSADPRGAIAAFLDAIQTEATARGYNFDATRIDPVERYTGTITVTDSQLAYELTHLITKVEKRNPSWLPSLARRLGSAGNEWDPSRADSTLPTQLAIPAHPMFAVVDGPIEDWERVN
ncbi:hypothetical protein J2S49_000856 [Arcanobacterium wilhelmae]|uniref:Pyrimidine dimer DNA glycosylase /DNA-(Apurinic or apyrimidinic site) lyase n=1 Tax=Arcanobacterium wilhelmae TaxID=1803177 RepID=A0ABT9NAN1_9ACTO|nr:pyrimidine dimer DNA glycosylase/endonuclease V [Arcanobacterium wilhelmae]MDP9800780.1 hypothetical protein [Arcanobacterium wilhelmae]WFN90158.1 pyrimidine dimer DNA glycosylase/endonuclease V [Arcanobacterium wilhelmae]